MSSIPNSAMPHAVAKQPAQPEPPEPKSGTAASLLGLALAPPLIVVGLGILAFSTLRALASDIARKVDASAGSQTGKRSKEKGMGVPV